MSGSCLFCKIVSGDIGATKIYEDDLMLAFRDINPQAPVHILLIPKIHIDSVSSCKPEHASLLGQMVIKLRELAETLGVSEKGYRVVVNTNEDGGQTVFHLHFHLLAGRPFVFPPG